MTFHLSQCFFAAGMDGRHDPPCSRTGRMSLTKQLSFVTRVTVVEAEGELELYNPLTGRFNLRVHVKFRVLYCLSQLTHVIS